MYRARVRRRISDGLAGTADTVQAIRALITEGGTDPRIISVARRIVAGLPERSPHEIDAVLLYVQRGMRFVNDPLNAETLTDPATIQDEIALEGKASGDCDDHVVYLGSLLEGIGYEVEPSVESYSPDGQPSHVTLRVRRGATIVHLDPTVKDGPAGSWAGKPTRVYGTKELTMIMDPGGLHTDALMTEVWGQSPHAALGAPPEQQNFADKVAANISPQTAQDTGWFQQMMGTVTPLAQMYFQTQMYEAQAKALAKGAKLAQPQLVSGAGTTTPTVLPSDPPPPEKNYTPWIIGGVAVAVIGAAMFMMGGKKKRR